MGWTETIAGGSLSIVEDTSEGQIINVVDNVPGGGDFNFDLGVASKDAMDVSFYINGEKQSVNIGEGDQAENSYTLPSGDAEIKWEFSAKTNTKFGLSVYRYEPPEASDIVMSEQFSNNAFDETWSGVLLDEVTLTEESMRISKEHLGGTEEYAEMMLSFSSVDPYETYIYFSHWVPENADGALLRLGFPDVNGDLVWAGFVFSSGTSIAQMIEGSNGTPGETVDWIKIFYHLFPY